MATKVVLVSTLSSAFVVGVYTLFSGSGENFDVGTFIEAISPYAWASTGIALCIGLSTIGAASGIFIVGSSILGGGVKTPRITSRNLMSVIFCEIVAVYGLIMGIIFMGKMNPSNSGAQHSGNAYFTGFAIFWAGFTVGMCDLICGITVGINGSATALGDAADSTLFFKCLVIEIFGSVIGLFGLIVGVLIATKAPDFGSFPKSQSILR